MFLNFLGSLETASRHLEKQRSPDTEAKRNKVRTACINRAKSRETIERPLPGAPSSSSSSETDLTKLNSAVQELELELSFSGIEFATEQLQEFGDSLTSEQRKKTWKKKKPKKSKTKKLKEQEEARKKELVDILCRGDLEKLKKLLENYLKSAEDSEKDKSIFINEALDDNSNTLLHIAALNEHVELVNFLMDNEADPCLKNKTQQTAYVCTQSKSIRDALKQFAKDNPEKFNYNKAHIPTNALTPEELAERKKAQRKVKREKEKEKKKGDRIKKHEDDEKNRFLQLSDREKRALAAERRIINQSGTVVARCFLCGSDMAGKVPFEYMGNRFCTIDCLKGHRMKNPINLSC